MDRQITSHLILTVQRYVEGLLPTISNSYCNLQVAICPLHRFPFLVHLPRSPPLPPAAPAPAIRRRRRGARRGGGDRSWVAQWAGIREAAAASLTASATRSPCPSSRRSLSHSFCCHCNSAGRSSDLIQNNLHPGAATPRRPWIS